MSKTKKPLALLTCKNLTVTSVLAVAALANVTGATGSSHTSEFELNNQSNSQANVTICHKGRDMQVSASGLNGHLAHGDSVGSCEIGGGGRGGL